MSDAHERFAALGREFLTWLWFESERNHGRVNLDGVGPIGVELTRRLALETGGAAGENSTVSADTPTVVEEARVALRTGKKVASTRLLLEVGERQFELAIHGESFVFSGVKLPTLLTAAEDERLAERFALIEELEAIVDGLYVQFARLRLDPDAWPETRAAMARWVLASEG